MIVIIPRGWPRLSRDEANSELRYALSPEEAQMIADHKKCQAEGHIEHMCPACGDRSCLRCGVGFNV